MRVVLPSVSGLLFSVFYLLQAQPANQPTIRVTTRLVQVSVLVHDKKGPVSDLKKEGFSLFDRGKEQKIAVFSVDSIDAPPKGWPPVPPNLFSNRMRRADTPTSITVILFDGLNTRIQDQAYARKQILKFLDQIQPGDRVALYLLGSNLRILHDFTNDPDHLAKALAKYHGRISGELDAADPAPRDPTGNDDLDQFLQNADQTMSDFYNVNRATWTLDAMEVIAHHLASLPGRKNLIWVSGGFPFTLGLEPEDFSLDNPNRERRTFSEETDRVARAMNDANIAIYPVDARGLMTDPAMSASNRGTAMTIPRGRNPTAAAPKIFHPPNIDTMQILAERSGGRAYYNTNDLTGAVRDAVNDGKVTYTLGFYPSSDDWDGKFHDIKVKVDRGGVDVRYRKGFVAYNEHAPTAKQLKDELHNAVNSPLEATGIGVNARVDIVDQPKPGSMRVVTQVDQTNFVLEQNNDHWVGKLEVLFVQYAPDGRVLNAEAQTLGMNLGKERYDDVQKRGLLYSKTVEPMADADHLRIVVMDHTSGHIGSLQIPIKK
ncbi:MAG TPA: VWA domain-containing protein [Bryobacteraceae bacterium]|nr:VWA domain-containing protein [Bryobacteraceae bacterium]